MLSNFITPTEDNQKVYMGGKWHPTTQTNIPITWVQGEGIRIPITTEWNQIRPYINTFLKNKENQEWAHQINGSKNKAFAQSEANKYLCGAFNDPTIDNQCKIYYLRLHGHIKI